MIDREKVIYSLERCTCHVPDACKDCSKYGGGNAIRCMEELLTDALSLLKAHEPHKKGYWKYPQSLDCCCSECGNQPDHEPGESVPLYDYCPYCGAEMAVKWDE